MEFVKERKDSDEELDDVCSNKNLLISSRVMQRELYDGMTACGIRLK